MLWVSLSNILVHLVTTIPTTTTKPTRATLTNTATAATRAKPAWCLTDHPKYIQHNSRALHSTTSIFKAQRRHISGAVWTAVLDTAGYALACKVSQTTHAQRGGVHRTCGSPPPPHTSRGCTSRDTFPTTCKRRGVSPLKNAANVFHHTSTISARTTSHST